MMLVQSIHALPLTDAGLIRGCLSVLCILLASFTHAETATSPDDIIVADGFQVELIYSVPNSDQGSWVCMTEDSRGRLICGDQRGGLYRLNVESVPPIVDQIPTEVGYAQGLVCAYDSLYVIVSGPAASGPGLYRLRDSDGDDQYDEVILLKPFELTNTSTKFRSLRLKVQNTLISRGHGPHGICLGPDGMLYVLGGNHTQIPTGVAKNSDYRNWDEDLLLPRIPDAQGIATGIKAPGGWVMRIDKDGNHPSLVCGGLRNPYDIAFNTNGDLFTFESDMEFDVGAPWYLPCRVHHLVAGGEYGWRYGSGKWPDYFTDSIPSVVDVGFGSPTGVTFGTGADFPVRYQRAMFGADWAYGRIFAFNLSADGSSYQGTFDVFLEGKPLAVTDLLVHSDGCLYFVTGGRDSQSGVYRVRYTGDVSIERTAQQHADPPERKLRQMLESLSVDGGSQTLDQIFFHLNNPDHGVRYAARLALERQPLSTWQDRALKEMRHSATSQTVIALARLGDQTNKQRLIDQLGALPLGVLPETQLLDALRAYGLIFTRLGPDTDNTHGIAKRLLPLLPSQSSSVNRELCRLLVYLEAPEVIEKGLHLMQTSESQVDQFHYAFVLRNLKNGWTIDQRTRYFSWLREANRRYSGGQSFQGFINHTFADAAKTLTSSEKVAVANIIRQKKEVDQPKSLPRQFVHNWQVDDLRDELGNTQHDWFKRGEKAYLAAQCDKCHRMRGSGGNTGPDLTGAGSRFSSEYLLDAILQPSKVIPDQYLNWQIATVDGNFIVGRILNEDDHTMTLRTDPYSPKTVTIEIDQISARQLSRISEMPVGLINTLAKQEIIDLIAYLRSGTIAPK